MKIQYSIELIRKAIDTAKRPAVMLSFGKDSMVMAHLIREAKVKRKFPGTHSFPIEVIYHRDPWFPHKHVFADKIIRSWSMEVHDFPPFHSGVKVKPEMLELVNRYHFGFSTIDIPKNVSPPEEYPRRDYICGLNDWLFREKTFLYDYPWDMVFVGHRSSDIDEFEGHVPLKSDTAIVGGVRMVFPLREWTDDDLWAYIKEHKIPVNEARYKGGKEANWQSNDHIHACTACIDPRETKETVYCPKLKQQVKNRGQEVLQLRVEPEYIERGEVMTNG